MLSGSGSTPVEVLVYAEWMRCILDELCASQNLDEHFIGVVVYTQYMLNKFICFVGILALKFPSHLVFPVICFVIVYRTRSLRGF